jgi:hypothetical protein
MMAGIERRHSVAEQYERVQREIADHAVVDAAEDILGHAWITQLERLRHATADAVTSAAQNVNGARRLLRACQAAGDPRHVAQAQDLLERGERDLARNMAESSRMLCVVDEELDLLARATAERVRRRLADLGRLETTHAAAIEAARPADDPAP